VDPDVAEARRAQRAQPAEIFEQRDLQRRLAQLYARAEELVPGDRVLHIHAESSVDEVGAQILHAISTNLLPRNVFQ
jgi:dTMP kinase